MVEGTRVSAINLVDGYYQFLMQATVTPLTAVAPQAACFEICLKCLKSCGKPQLH